MRDPNQFLERLRAEGLQNAKPLCAFASEEERTAVQELIARFDSTVDPGTDRVSGRPEDQYGD